MRVKEIARSTYGSFVSQGRVIEFFVVRGEDEKAFRLAGASFRPAIAVWDGGIGDATGRRGAVAGG